MASRRRTARRGVRPRRRYEWARSSSLVDFELNNEAGPADLMSGFQNILGADAAGVTITRIRGEFTWAYLPNTDATANGIWRTPIKVQAGIRVDENQVANLTDTQQINKLDQLYADWMFYEQSWVYPSVAWTEENQSIVSENLILRQPIDIKSQRRFDELQQSLFLFAGSPAILGDDHVRFTWDLQILLKMP